MNRFLGLDALAGAVDDDVGSIEVWLKKEGRLLPNSDLPVRLTRHAHCQCRQSRSFRATWEDI